MRKDSANSDEISIFATSRPSLQCMKCECKTYSYSPSSLKQYTISIMEKGDYFQATVSIGFFLNHICLVLAVLWHCQPKSPLKNASATAVCTRRPLHAFSYNIYIFKCIGQPFGPRSDCTYRSSQIWVLTVCRGRKFISFQQATERADGIFVIGAPGTGSAKYTMVLCYIRVV